MKNCNICFYHLREERKTLKPDFLIKDINKYNEFKHHIDAFRVHFSLFLGLSVRVAITISPLSLLL